MEQSFKKILNASIHAEDGAIGHLDDLLFDDQKWTIRYIVVKTGGLLNRHRVLISPLGVSKVDLLNKHVELSLTRQQVEKSPDVNTDQPVFRQMEQKYFDYFGWPYYWDDIGIWGIGSRNPLIIGDPNTAESSSTNTNDKTNPHLRSCRIVSGYTVEYENLRFGYVEDFLFEDKSWDIQNILVKAQAMFPNRSMKISPKSVQSVDWYGQHIKVSLSKSEIDTTTTDQPL